MRVHIKVTTRDLTVGYRTRGRDQPIAMAIQRRVKYGHVVYAGLVGYTITRTSDNMSWTKPYPPLVQRKMDRYYNFKRVDAFSFYITKSLSTSKELYESIFICK